MDEYLEKTVKELFDQVLAGDAPVWCVGTEATNQKGLLTKMVVLVAKGDAVGKVMTFVEGEWGDPR